MNLDLAAVCTSLPSGNRYKSAMALLKDLSEPKTYNKMQPESSVSGYILLAGGHRRVHMKLI